MVRAPRRPSVFSALLLLAAAPLARGGVVFVDGAALGAGTGASWGDAHVDLQAALAAAQAGDELWVAAGTYTPHASDASVSFALQDGVALYGGFAGTETARDQRDWVVNVTSLSGDVGQDDVVGSGLYWYTNWNIHSANSGHVVRAQGVGPATVLDGFTIEAGHTGPVGTPAGNELMYGSGLYCVGASPTLRNLTFLHNEAAFASGGGVYLWDSSPLVEHCRFLENYAHLGNGAGMAVYGASAPEVRGCEFARNVAVAGAGDASGAGLYLWTDQPLEVTGCLFEDNRTKQFYSQSSYSTYGGGLSVFLAGAVVRDCVFRRNHAQFGGGLMTWGPTTVVDSLFVDNVAFAVPNDPYPDIGGWGGGVMVNAFGAKELHLVGVTLAYNHAVKYAGVYAGGSASARIDGSILWGNVASNPEVAGGWKAQLGGTFALDHCCVQTIFAPHAAGEDPIDPKKLPGCTDQDPLFVVPGAAGDQHLAAASPCVDAGRNDLVEPFTLLDLGGGGRAQDDLAVVDTGVGAAPVVDMGAYERGAGALAVDTEAISASAGGAQHLAIDLGGGHAGDLYWVVGSLSGTSPGLPIGGLVVPLRWDAYTQMTLTSPNVAPLLGTFGVLDAGGRAQAALALPAGSPAWLGGLRADHAAVVLTAFVPSAVTGTTPLRFDP